MSGTQVDNLGEQLFPAPLDGAVVENVVRAMPVRDSLDGPEVADMAVVAKIVICQEGKRTIVEHFVDLGEQVDIVLADRIDNWWAAVGKPHPEQADYEENAEDGNHRISPSAQLGGYLIGRKLRGNRDRGQEGRPEQCPRQ